MDDRLNLLVFRIERVEERVKSIERFIFGAILACAMFSGTLLWMIADLPSKIVRQVDVLHKN